MIVLAELSTEELWDKCRAAHEAHRQALVDRTYYTGNIPALRRISVKVNAAKKEHEAVRQELIKRGEIDK